ncbi:hypothetical protein ACTID9_04560 [Brevibacillus fluminis]|uniref:hypothetical protein n=1 Tax=Brevibacillus fluminis TaxID=511487 RepID=UPI003F8A5CC7
MFHPTVFDNLKVVLEGAVYDADFDNVIFVTGRSDLADLAAFHRSFQIEFCLADDVLIDPADKVMAHVKLKTSLADIASEQLEQSLTDHIGCTICITFKMRVREVARETEAIDAILNEIWGNRPQITQQLMAQIDSGSREWPPAQFEDTITLDFLRKIDEGNIQDMRDLLEHCFLSMKKLKELL